jgi:FKBP-type peptidyl-prolyl cis-trans isomerase
MKTVLRLLVFLAISFSLTSCLNKFVESDVDALYKKEVTQILEYGQANNISLTKDASGLYYRKLVTNAGGASPSDQYDFHIAYSFKTIDGTLISEKKSTDTVVVNFFTTNGFRGLFFSLLLLNEGEKGQFFIPSYLAYGENPPSGVAKNAIIVAEIELIDLLTEDERIERYLKKKGLKVSDKTNSGLRVIYQSEPVSQDTVKNGDIVEIKYKGMFLNDFVFDAGVNPLKVTLGTKAVVSGFEEGIKKLKKGQKAKIIFPSALGYGTTGRGSIPPYTPLMFDIELSKINDK